MGRSKNELKRIHAKRVRKTKQKLQLFKKGELSADKLTALAKRFIEKARKKKLAAAS